MMTDTKAIRAAALIKSYCQERCCDNCIFQNDSGCCVLMQVRNPSYFPEIKTIKGENHENI